MGVKMDTRLHRFGRYVRIDPQSDEASTTYPSSAGQLLLGRLLAEELRAMSASDVEHDGHGLVWATIPATVKHAAPVIAWNSHVDTSPETNGRAVKPIIHRAYDGRDIVLPGDPSKVLRVSEF